jgi:hypothetical protein
MDLVSITVGGGFFLHAAELKKNLNTFLCSLLLNQNSQIYLIYIHSKRYILFSLVIGPLTVTRLFLSMDHKHNIEKYAFIHVVMCTLYNYTILFSSLVGQKKKKIVIKYIRV